VGAFFDFGQARLQIAQLLLGLLITVGGQGFAHNITSTTPLGCFLRSVANCRSAQASKSASSAATMICRNGQTSSSLSSFLPGPGYAEPGRKTTSTSLGDSLPVTKLPFTKRRRTPAVLAASMKRNNSLISASRSSEPLPKRAT